MASTTHSPDPAGNLAAATSTKPHETSPQLVPGKKRSASESELQGDDETVREAQADDAKSRSPKRVKGDGSSQGGEMPDSKSLEGEPPSADSTAAQAPQMAHNGWNRGVSSGLRTSFAGKDKPRTSLSRQVSESPAQPTGEGVDIESLTMPSGDANFSRSNRGSVWQARFAKWCVRLMALNKDQERLKDSAVLRDAWAWWLETRTSLSRAHREAAVQGAKPTNLDFEKLKEMFSEAQEAEPQGPWMDSPADTVQADSPESEQRSDGQPESTKSTTHGSQDLNDWTIPPPQHCSDFEHKPKDQRAWEEKFVSWCRSLDQLNNSKIKVGTTRERNRLTESYLKWVGTIDGLSKTKAAAARRAAVHYAQDNSALLVAVFATAASTNGLQPTESVASPHKDAAPASVAAELEDHHDESINLVDGDDAEYREKYFPGLHPNDPFCRMCASRGHDAVECPQMTCRFCQDSRHRSFSCPTRRRCTKCKQLGHTKQDCTEKLALPQDQWECAFCQSRDHVDASCHELWRSFVFQPDAVRKVRSLPIFCYCCGREGHHGGVCGLNPQKTKEGPWETWSQANCDRYLDPASSEVAIIYEDSAAGPSSSSDRPDLGKSIVPQRHIFFEEADDDDDAEDFIRPPVQKNARVGHISFSGSNSGGVNRGGKRQGRHHNDSRNGGASGYTQPPLPPGPPPPLPPQNYRERRNGGRRRGGGGGARY